MIKFNPEFQSVLGLSMGVFFGVFSYGLFMTILYISAFEYMTFAMAYLAANDDTLVSDRITVNLMFLFGWVLSKYLLVRETGFEETYDNLKICTYSFMDS